jgi:hypothetical protein
VSVICEMAAPFVANSAVEGSPVSRPFRGHAEACLKCQARHAAMTRTARALAAMSKETLAGPLDLEWRVMSALEGDLAVARSWRTPIAVTAAIVSMTAAVLIWRLRPRTP